MMFLLAFSLIVTPTFAQASSQIYGCQHYGSDVVHCDLMRSEMQGYQVIGNSTLIHPLSGNTIFVDGKVGKAAELRAEYRESIEIMNEPALSPDSFTVAFWIKQSKFEPYSHIVSHSNKAQTAGWLFDMFAAAQGDTQGAVTSSLRFGVFNSNGTIFSPGEIPVTAGQDFVHIAGTFDGSNLTIYKDGEKAGTTTFAGNYTVDPGVPVRIGSAAYCSSCNRWSGAIDDLQFYDRALAPDEITKLYESGTAEGVVGHWTFDNDTSDALGGHDGTSTTLLTSMAFSPDGRLFFSEKNTGEVRVMSPDFQLQEEPFARVDDVYASWEQGMLGIALDPDFKDNHYLYLYYTALVGIEKGDGGKVINRLVRFTEQNNTGQDMTVLLDNIPASRGFHSGGALAFGSDGKLYVTVGDATEHIFAQDPSIVVGKTLRINKDGTIPSDNPYPGSPVYTIGHRNMFGIAFDTDGAGMVAENGDFHYDELNVLVKGGNYGFPTIQPANLPPERANNSALKPLRSYWDAIAPTQMIYYVGDSIPELKGMFVFGSFTGDMYGVKLSDNKTRIEVEQKVELGHFPFVPTIAVAQSPDGHIYYGAYQIYRLDSVSQSTQNVFQVTADAPDGVEVSDLQLDPTTNGMIIDTKLTKNIRSDDEKLSVKIPNSLVDNISAVTLEGPSGATSADFSIDESTPDYKIVSVPVQGAAESSIKIKLVGTSVVPEFPPVMASITALAILSAVVATALLASKRARTTL